MSITGLANFVALLTSFSLTLLCEPALNEILNVSHMQIITIRKSSWHWFSERYGLALLQ